MSDLTVFNELVLARWGDDGFQITGWGLFAIFLAATMFGTFVREVAKILRGDK